MFVWMCYCEILSFLSNSTVRLLDTKTVSRSDMDPILAFLDRRGTSLFEYVITWFLDFYRCTIELPGVNKDLQTLKSYI